MYGCLYSLSRLSIRELPIKNSLDFRGESILTLPHAPLHNIHLVMDMVAVKLKLLYRVVLQSGYIFKNIHSSPV